MRRAPLSLLGPVAVLAALPVACVDWGLFRRQPDLVEPVVVEERFAQAPEPAVDVLWVIDTSCSMAEEQAALADAMSAFVEALEPYGLAWQAGVVSMDNQGAEAGRLQGVPWIVHAGLADPGADLARAASLGTSATAAQAGLDAAALALSEPLRSGDNVGFRRPRAALHIVVLSDGDDESGLVLGDDPSDAFLDLLAAEATSSSSSARLSAIVGPLPEGCATASPGTVFAELAERSGGVVGDVCAGDLAVVAEAIGQSAITWQDRFELQASPVEGTVAVWVDDERQGDDAWSLEWEPPAILFAQAPPPGAEIRVRYELAEEEAP